VTAVTGKHNLPQFLSTFLLIAFVAAPALFGQVATIVPPVVNDAKPVTVERIKIHGKSLEGTPEGDAVDRDVLVFLPFSYAKDTSRRYPVVIFRISIAHSAPSSGRVPVCIDLGG
jgi:hypothetical protein